MSNRPSVLVSRLRSRFACCLLALLPAAAAAVAQAPTPVPAPGKPAEAPAPSMPQAAPEKKPPEEKLSTTRHTLTLDGQKIAYTATAGNVVLKDDDGTAKASVFFIAYARDPEPGRSQDPGSRPVTFSFNGGPGAARITAARAITHVPEET